MHETAFTIILLSYSN